MNYKIQEFALQAGYIDRGNNHTAYAKFNHEEFAELIVRECVKLCEHESNDDEYDQYDMGMSVKTEDIKASIMKTFGVK